ncbi:AAA family ATPase [Virgibacillus halophilus]|uniref:AAA family ATPase n=1 Tax=Tigheibacillus halophilus TaxID=361280 RepID=A0ABU5C9A8_9BACI|nr:AAA family ATPase [Virgibacillus halophilus]
MYFLNWGEANINQVTFQRFLQERVGKYTVESPFEQMEFVLTSDKNRKADTIRIASVPYKSSLKFKQFIDAYAEELKFDGIQFRNIVLRGSKLVSKETIRDYFYSLDEGMTIPNKMELTAKWLLQEIRPIQKAETNKDWVMEQVELMDKEAFQQAYYQNQEIDEDDFSLEEKFLREEVVDRAFQPIKKRIKHYGFVHVGKTYQALFTETEGQANVPENWEEICKQTVENLSEMYLTWEDATPFLYFKDLLFGPRKERMVRHLFIDEAQDYSAFQFAYIKHTFPYTRMTLLGDSNQAIYTYATDENPLLTNQLKRKLRPDCSYNQL